MKESGIAKHVRVLASMLDAAREKEREVNRALVNEPDSPRTAWERGYQTAYCAAVHDALRAARGALREEREGSDFS